MTWWQILMLGVGVWLVIMAGALVVVESARQSDEEIARKDVEERRRHRDAV